MPTESDKPNRARRGRPSGSVERRLPAVIVQQATAQLCDRLLVPVASVYRELRVAQYGVSPRTFHYWATRLRRHHFGEKPIKYRGSADAGLKAQRKAISLLNYLGEGERPDFIPIIVREMARITGVRLRGDE